MDKFFKPTVLLGIGLFSFIMCLISAALFLITDSPNLMLEAFIGYGFCGVAFLTMGILKGLE